MINSLVELHNAIKTGQINIESVNGGFVASYVINKQNIAKSISELIKKYLFVKAAGENLVYFLSDNQQRVIIFDEYLHAEESLMMQIPNLHKQIAFAHYNETGIKIPSEKSQIVTFYKRSDE